MELPKGKLRNMTGIYLTRGESLLMLYRVGSRVVAPSWCGIGGHFEKEELNQARDCALRELFEETGLREEDISGLTFRYVTLRLKNGEIRQNYYFFGELKPEARLPESCGEGRLAWVPFEEVLDREMPFTARGVLEHYFKEGRFTTELYAGISTPEGTGFTVLSEF
ncbi:MAG: NUDIX domain-containing protein [Clostridia bacterium]|nr:NUDIX domain-containing protein [Clostridia bacterium]